MKAKKIIALTMSLAMTVGAASMLAACKDDEDKEPEAPSFVEDKTVYYAVGASNGEDGSLYEQGWAPETIKENLTFVRDTTVTNENVFTLKMKMYEGDAFKILHDFEGDWDTVQINISNFGEQLEGEGEERVVKYNGTTCFVTEGTGNVGSNIICAEGADGEYTFTMKTYPGTETAPVLSVVKDKSIPRLTKMYLNSDLNDFGFGSNKNDYNMKNNNGNWTCVVNVTAEDLCRDAEGKAVTTGAEYVAIQVKNLGGDDEVKEFAATPGADDTFKKVTLANEGVANLLPEGTYVISWNQETKEVTISKSTHSMYFIGSFNNWATADEDYKLTPNEDESVWTGKLVVKEATTMKLYNSITGAYYPDGMGTDINLEAGTYIFKFDATTNEVKYEKYEYYVVGTFVDSEGKVHNFGNDFDKEFNPVLVETATKGTYTVEVEVKDVTSVGDYGWVKPAIFALKVAGGTELGGITDWFNPVAEQNEGDNIKLTQEGTYIVTLVLTLDADGNVTGGSCSAQLKG